MPKFLFWNLNKSERRDLVCRLARLENVDVIILAESALHTARFLEEINDAPQHYHYVPGECGHISLFTRFQPSLFPAILESHRISIRRLDLPARAKVTVVSAHLPSKMLFGEDDQIFESVHLARLIEQAELHEGHQRTIVIGDLNMNPFESGMVAARGGLHAVMSRRVAARATRKVQQENYKFFYNPMWSHFGDRAGAAGTFYYDSSEPLCYFWNIFDQVLLRPDLLKGFQHEQLRIVTEVDGVSLIKEDGCPDKTIASDHLPLVLEVDF
jgi:hypothetical protein